jgi:hypothetical protein
MTGVEWRPPRRWTDSLGLPVFLAVAMLALFLVGNVPLWRSVVISLASGAGLYFVIRSGSAPRAEWQPAPVNSARFARRNLDWLLAGLETGLADPDRFLFSIRPRFRALAEGLLHRQRLDLNSDAARQLLGARNHQLLTDPDCARPTRSELVRLAAAITRLRSDDPALPPHGDRIGP